MDIDDERLTYIKRAVDKIVATGNYQAKVIATKDRTEALKMPMALYVQFCREYMYGAMILKYQKNGVDINVGDIRTGRNIQSTKNYTCYVRYLP